MCRPTGDKWQSESLFLAIFDPRSAIVKSVFRGECITWSYFVCKDNKIHVLNKFNSKIFRHFFQFNPEDWH